MDTEAQQIEALRAQIARQERTIDDLRTGIDARVFPENAGSKLSFGISFLCTDLEKHSWWRSHLRRTCAGVAEDLERMMTQWLKDKYPSSYLVGYWK